VEAEREKYESKRKRKRKMRETDKLMWEEKYKIRNVA
jgi:hypothetical protein